MGKKFMFWLWNLQFATWWIYLNSEENMKNMKSSTTLVEGFAFLEDNGIAHGDIKTQNLCLFQNEKEEYFYKIADFGISLKLPKGCKTIPDNEIKGFTRKAPEIPTKISVYVSKINPFIADIYCLGWILLEMMGVTHRNRSLILIILIYHLW